MGLCGVALAIPFDVPFAILGSTFGAIFSMAMIGGFLGLTGRLIVTGVGEIRDKG